MFCFLNEKRKNRRKRYVLINGNETYYTISIGANLQHVSNREINIGYYFNDY